MSAPADPRSELQAALGSAFTLERELGGGGMSKVFLARETALARDVVVKVVAPELHHGLSAERFTREVQVAARLQQANIVPLLSAGDAGGMAYYTMPYVSGESLRARMAQGRIPVGEALDILRDVARALAYAHGQGIVHRDIKPDNVLLSSGTAVVTDFGIAKALSASRTSPDMQATGLTQAGISLGTPAYMAPEQALGEDVDARSDIYAWGVMAYELLSGSHPFAQHTTTQRLIAAHISEKPKPLTGVPPRVAALVMKCLAKDPADRPWSATEVLDQLSTGRDEGGTRVILIAVLSALVVVSSLSLALALRRHPAAPAVRSLVVVPFENQGNPGDAYFAEGVSDEIAGHLARLPGIAVIGREGVRKFRGTNRSPREIGRELGAAWVLSGTVRWARMATNNGVVDGSTRVRIVPALTSVADGVEVWGEPFEEPLTDVFKAQATVAEGVASALSVKLGGAARAALSHQESTDPEARDEQLLGRYLLRQRGAANLRNAMTAFQRAITRDSSYARAWAGLSEAEALFPIYYDTSDVPFLAHAMDAAQRAVALDSTLPEVQLALARSYMAQFRLKEALRAADRSLALDPNATLAHSVRYELLTGLGRKVAADSAARRAYELDRHSALALNNLAMASSSLGYADSAVYYAQQAVREDPGEPLWKRTLGGLYALDGRLEDAVHACTGVVASEAECRIVLGSFTAPISASQLASIESMGRRSRMLVPPSFRALIYARQSLPDSMFTQLSAAIAAHDDGFFYLITNPAFDRYQHDPRWDEIIGALRRR